MCLLLASILFSASNIAPVTAQETIHIRADGSIDPPTAPISTLDNFTYTFSHDIYESIQVQRNNTIIDGNGYLVQGTGGGQSGAPECGANLTLVSNVTIKNMSIKNFDIGILLVACSECRIIENNLTANRAYGFAIDAGSSNNTFLGNTVADNLNDGIGLGGSGSDNVVAQNNVTNNGGTGIDNAECTNTTIYENNIAGNMIGIDLAGPLSFSYTVVHGNNITRNTVGVWLIVFNNLNNRISQNNILNNNGTGIVVFPLRGSPDNTICYNNFVNNAKQVTFTGTAYSVKWDNGCPSGGNYWNDYNRSDLYSGSYQNETGSDGIGDEEYSIDENNIDNYPLMGMFSEFDWISTAAPEQRIQTICNSTISNPVYTGSAISFDVTGDNGTNGFCRICIPEVFMNGTFHVFVNGTETSYTTVYANSTHNYIYFTFTHSTQEIVIVPEFPAFLILSILMITTLLSIQIHKRKKV